VRFLWLSSRSTSSATAAADPPRLLYAPLGNIIATGIGCGRSSIDDRSHQDRQIRVELTAQKEIIVMIELWSPSDILDEIQFKLDEYVANGAKLGFLIYPPQRNVYVYRPGHIPQRLDSPQSAPRDPELQGFIWPDGNLPITRLTAY